MPLVKTQKSYFGKPMTARFNVTNDGRFWVKIPEWAEDALGKDKIEAETLAELERKFELERQQYYQLMQSTRRVILYKFWLQDKTQSYIPRDGERDDIGFGVGKGIQFAVCNATETQHANANDEVFRTSWKQTEGPYPPGYNYGRFGNLCNSRENPQVLEWSEERQNWFLMLCRAMDGLIEKMKQLDENQVKLLEYVNQQHRIGFSAAAPGDG